MVACVSNHRAQIPIQFDEPRCWVIISCSHPRFPFAESKEEAGLLLKLSRELMFVIPTLMLIAKSLAVMLNAKC